MCTVYGYVDEYKMTKSSGVTVIAISKKCIKLLCYGPVGNVYRLKVRRSSYKIAKSAVNKSD